MLLTCAVDFDFLEAKCFGGRVRTVNDDEAKCLTGRRAHDGRVSTGVHGADELIAQRV